MLAKSFRITVFDNRGAGRSSQSMGSYSIKQLAGDCIQLLEQLNITSAYFAGHSLGGQIVQEIAISYPQYVAKAVIITSTYHYPEFAKMHFQNVARLMEQGVNSELVFRTIFPWVFSSSFLRQTEMVDLSLQAFQATVYPQSYAGYCGQIAALREYNSFDELSMINAPVLLITGDDDLLIPTAHSEIMLEAIPNSYHARIADCGHIPQIEAPGRLANLIHQFLR